MDRGQRKVDTQDLVSNRVEIMPPTVEAGVSQELVEVHLDGTS